MNVVGLLEVKLSDNLYLHITTIIITIIFNIF